MDLAPSEAVKRVRKWEWQKRKIVPNCIPRTGYEHRA